jgi:solute carrier family 13 (sodium-dependent dicarboxylate transporter), member 2/3/5
MERNGRMRRVGRILNTGTKNLFSTAAFIGTWPTRKIEDALNIVYGYDKDSGINPPINTRALSIFLTCFLLASFTTYYSFQYTTLPEEAAWMAGIFSLACLLWVTEALPLFATSILVIGLQILLISNPGSWPGIGFEKTQGPDFKFFLEPLADPILVLFFGGFLLAKAAVKRGVDASLAALVLRLFGATPAKVLLGMMLITAFFSMWMSNTATTTMMIALLIPLFSQIPEEKEFQKGLLLAIPFAANIGGMGTPIASPPNAVALGYLNAMGLNISFTQWMTLSIPLVITMLLIAYQILLKKYAPSQSDNKIILEKKPIDSKGKFVLLIFLLTIGLWLTEGYHGLPTAVVALIPAIAFTATGLLTKYDINNLDWNILILIAGGIALGKGMSVTGLDLALGTFFPKNSTYLFSILILGSLIFSTLISNTATANLLIPVGVSLAISPEGNIQSYMAKEIAIGIALIASMAMSLPVSTAPNTIAYAQGKLQTQDFFRVGSLLGLIAMILIVAAATILDFIWSN